MHTTKFNGRKFGCTIARRLWFSTTTVATGNIAVFFQWDKLDQITYLCFCHFPVNSKISGIRHQMYTTQTLATYCKLASSHQLQVGIET